MSIPPFAPIFLPFIRKYSNHRHREDDPPFTSLQSDPPRWHVSPSLKESTVPSDDPVERWAQSSVRRLIKAYKERNHDCWKPPSPDKNEFDTDSSQSEDETDCEDDHIPEMPEDAEILEHISNVLHLKKLKGNKSLGSPVLDPINRAMVDHVMKDFWQIFHEEWSAGIRKCAETSYSTNSSPSAHGSTPPTGKSSEKSNKRTRENDGDKQPGKGGENPNKRQNTSGCPKQALEEAKIFACPYRKHNARRYNHHSLKWRTCALTPLQTVARVK
jgi:hypothetical protein